MRPIKFRAWNHNTNMKTFKVSEEFVVGKHEIGYVGNDFKSNFGNDSFEERALGKFQKLPRSMSDEEIESELKPGICTLGDVLAFLKNPPEGSKDGNYNLFSSPSFVVLVHWFGDDWRVSTWGRGDGTWIAGDRVFSPATGSSGSQSPQPLDALTLDQAIKIIKEAGSVIERLEKIEAWIEKVKKN